MDRQLNQKSPVLEDTAVNFDIGRLEEESPKTLVMVAASNAGNEAEDPDDIVETPRFGGAGEDDSVNGVVAEIRSKNQKLRKVRFNLPHKDTIEKQPSTSETIMTPTSDEEKSRDGDSNSTQDSEEGENHSDMAECEAFWLKVKDLAKRFRVNKAQDDDNDDDDDFIPESDAESSPLFLDKILSDAVEQSKLDAVEACEQEAQAHERVQMLSKNRITQLQRYQVVHKRLLETKARTPNVYHRGRINMRIRKLRVLLFPSLDQSTRNAIINSLDGSFESENEALQIALLNAIEIEEEDVIAAETQARLARQQAQRILS